MFKKAVAVKFFYTMIAYANLFAVQNQSRKQKLKSYKGLKLTVFY